MNQNADAFSPEIYGWKPVSRRILEQIKVKPILSEKSRGETTVVHDSIHASLTDGDSELAAAAVECESPQRLDSTTPVG